MLQIVPPVTNSLYIAIPALSSQAFISRREKGS
jgi:hypothetical protein